MTIVELLGQLRERGIKLWAEEGKLRFQAPKGALTPELRDAIGAQKADILAFLQDAQAAVQDAPPPIPVQQHGDHLPLSFAQQRLWFLDQLEPGTPLYNIPSAVRLSGTLNRAALQRSVDAIVARHESLRTTFVTVDQDPVQQIAPHSSVEVAYVDLRSLPEDEREAMAWQLGHVEALTPFELAHGPLLRVKLIQLTATEYMALLTMHHIISDGWSMSILIGELAMFYRAFAEGRPAPLPPLPLQYADYAVWQRETLQGAVLERQLAFWRQQLAGAPEALELPTDRPRPAAQTFSGDTQVFTLPTSLMQQLHALSQRTGATLYMTVLGAFQVLLARYSGQDDILVGSPIANRTRKELEGLIGFFANTLVMRGDLSGDPTFAELLGRLRQSSLGAFGHQDVPFERLVEELRPVRDMSRSPLFQVMLVLQNAPANMMDLPDLTLQVLLIDSGTAKFDLTMTLAEQPAHTVGSIEYNTDLFDHATIERMIGHFQILLEQIAADANRPISRLPLMTAGEQATLERWNATAAPYPELTAHELVAQQARATPDALAVVSGEATLTYAELDARANQLAHHLRSHGVTTDTPVGLCIDRSLELVIGMLGILKAGGAYVPLDPHYPAERLTLMIGAAAVPVLLTARTAGEGIAIDEQPLPIGDVIAHFAGTVIDMGDDAAAIAAQPASAPDMAHSPDQLAYVIYTSGSTGVPKGVAMPHRPLVNLLAWQEPIISGPARTLQYSSPSFDASFQEIFTAWAGGGTLVLVAESVRRDPDLLAAYLTAQRVERLYLPFVALQQLAEVVQALPEPPAHLRDVITAGEQLQITPALRHWFRRAPHTRLHNQYGPSETHVVTAYTLDGSADTWPDLPSIGTPIANTQVYLLDTHRQPVPIGVVGELYFGGVCLAREYLRRPDLTAERFVLLEDDRVRAYKTGDLARYRPDGTLEFLGRADTQVKIRGYRIEPGEIETALAQHPAVREAAVVAHATPTGTKQLVAYVVPHTASDDLAGELRTMLAGKLPEYMVPSAFLLLDAFPRTPSGKLDRKNLPAPDTARPALEQEYVGPRTPLETTLAELWGVVLGKTAIGINDNFFELGGHSLLATQLVSRVRTHCYVNLPLRDLFAAPTIAGMAERIEQHRATSDDDSIPHLVALDRTGPQPLSFSQERMWFLDQLEPDNPFYNLAAAVRVSGTFSRSAFQQAIDATVARHEALRTTFIYTNGQPLQVIAEPSSVPIPSVDLRAVPAADRDALIQQMMDEEARQPFNLADGPLLRIRVLELGVQDHLVLFTMHHIISDGWAMSVLVRDVGTFYSAFLRGETPDLPPLPIQYADFSVWQRGWLQGAALERQLSYWKGQLGATSPRGPVRVLDMPTDRPRPPVQEYAGNTIRFRLPAPLVQRITALSNEEGGTPFMALLAAFQVLLMRYSGQDDISVGTPIANRTRSEIEPLIGCFINTLVLRGDLSGRPDFRELLRRTRVATLGAYDHQDLPFEVLVDAIQPDRQLSHNPLSQVMFILQNTPLEPLVVPEAVLTSMPMENGTAKTDLTLEIAPIGDEWIGSITYSIALFDEATMWRLAGHYRTLLEGIVAAPDTPIASLPLLTADDIRQLAEWNAPTIPFEPATMHDMVDRQARRTPDDTALIDGVRHISYRELNNRANQLAHALQARGVGPEVCVGICMRRTSTLIVGLLGILKAGGTYVPLDPAYPAERIQFMLDDSRAELILTVGDDAPPLVGNITSIDLDAEWPQIARYPTSTPDSRAIPDNLAYLIYTSGSTGRPKGVAIPHFCAVGFLAWAHAAFTPAQFSGMLASTSICFDLSIYEIFGPLTSGGTVILAENALALPDLPAAQQVTVLNTVPSAAAALLRGPGLPRTLGTVNLAGEPLPLTLVQNVYAATQVQQVWNLYGPSEDTTYSTYAIIPPDARHVTIGKPLPNSQVYILDSILQQTPIGVPGEVYIGGAGLTRGYYDRPDLTAEKFVPNPFAEGRLYRTGDLARWRYDGTLDYLGRIDHQVKVRGFRIELGEIETVLRRHQQVRDCVVVAREDRPGEKYLAAYLSTTEDAPTVNELRQHVQAHLPDYMVPSAFVLLESLPLTPNGKVDRRALPAPDANRADLGDAYLAPRTPTEQTLARIWGSVLNAERVGINDNFFALGGHSLLATQLVSRVREEIAVDLPLRDLFAAPTVGAMAAMIDQMGERHLSDELAKAPPLRPRNAAGPRPLSFSQERLWFLDQLEPGSPLYSMPSALRVSGVFEPALFERTINTMIARHESLRTTFTLRNGEPVQIVAPPTPIAMPLIDLQPMPADRREQRARDLAREEALTPFDLARGPLIRVAIIRLEPHEHVVLFTTHHIISDGWSIGVILEEISTIYRAYARGEEPHLPPLSIQYPDYAVWQRNWLQGEALERQLSYWKHQLGAENPRGAAPHLDLPTDRPRPAMQGFDGRTIGFTLPQKLTNGLTVLSQMEQVTPFMTLLAAFQILLMRYSGQDDITVGSPIANRTRKEVEPLIGCFINTLVLRTDLSGNPSFRSLLQRVRTTTLGAYDHQDLPFEVLVDALQPNRQLSYNPLFQVMFVMQNAPMQALDLADAKLSIVDLETDTAKIDLSLEMVPVGDTLTGSINYNTDLFDHATIERMLEHFFTLLDSIIANPLMTIDRLPMLTASEARQMREWNDTAMPVPQDICLHTAFAAQAARTPDATAVVFGQQRLTFAELDAQANQLAHHLRPFVEPDTLIGLSIPRSADMIVGILGILKAGGAYVPLDPTYPSERLAFMAEDAQIPLMLTANTPNPVSGPWQVVDLIRDRAEIASHPTSAPETAVQASNLAYVIYTSGSTGRPKGVMIEHRSTINLAAALNRAIYDPFATRALRVSMNAPIAFDASVKQLVTLCSGHALYILPDDVRRDGVALLEYTREHQIDVLDCVPSQLKLLLAAGLLDGNGWAPALVLPGGEALDTATWATLAAAPDTQFFNVYGPTECTVDATTIDVRTAPERPTIGRALPNVRLYVLDANLQPVPVGVPGELCIGGLGLARGYLHRPDLTADRFVTVSIDDTPTRIYRTGDLVRFLPGGTVEFLGRLDHQVKVRGYRIELGEIESAIREYPAVQDVAVIVREDIPGDQQLTAYLRAATAPDIGLIRSFLRERMPDYMVPPAFVLLDAFPLTPNGKIDRRALPAPDAIYREREAEYVAPSTKLELWLADLWAAHFRTDRIGLNDHFFQLGGNSIQAAVFINRMQELLGEYVYVIALFEAPTLGELARYLTERYRPALVRAGLVEPDEAGTVAGELGTILPIQRATGEPLPVSFAQQRLWFLDQLEPGSPLYNIPTGVRMRGWLHADALQHSFDTLVARHESLRTSFAMVDGEPVQMVSAPASLPIRQIDLRDTPAEDREAHASALAREEARRPFALDAAPLVRATLLQLADDDHILLVNIHHIVSDGWSNGVLIRELATLYRGFVMQRPPELPPLGIQYADFAIWQREWFRGGVLERQLDYWRQQLAGAPAALELPTDRPRPAAQTFRGDTRDITIAAGLLHTLTGIGQREGATLFMTLLAAFQIVLARYSGQNDVLVGSPIANRTRRELEGLIGFFVNTLVLRGDLSGDPTFPELLARTRKAALGAFANQDVPFEYLVEAIQPERDLSRSPLFQVMLVLQNAPGDPLELPGLTLTPLEADSGTAKFDLLLSFVELPNGLAGTLEYNTDLFDGSTMERLLAHFHTLLQSIAADANRPISRLPMLLESEQQTLAAWNDTAAPYSNAPVHEQVAAQARRTPDQVAVESLAGRLTYAELDARANQLAHALRGHGIAADTPVGICMERSLELMIGVLGILKAGGAYVPLDPHYPAERLAVMLGDSRAPVLLTAQPAGEALPGVAALRAQYTGVTIDLIADADALAQQRTSAPDAAATLDHLAYVIYTSGSTGVPKGVAMPHRPLSNLLAWQQRVIAGPARTLQFSSPSFDVSFQEIFTTWASGGTLVLPTETLRRDPEALAMFLNERQIERLFMPFVALQQLADVIQTLPEPPAHLRDVITAGEQLQSTPALRAWFRRAAHTRLHNHYGPTETHVVTAYTLASDPDTWAALPSIGTPIANTQVLLLDAHRQPVPVGAVGELYFSGDALAQGYLHRPDLTGERFVELADQAVRAYKTGDLARYHPDGTLEFLGRADTQVKIRGYRIEPGEIETVLAQHPAVREAVVVARTRDQGAAQLVAYVIADRADDQNALLGDLRTFLGERLPEYMVPSGWMALERWPLTPSGKVDRRALPAPDALHTTGGSYVAPRDTLELRLAQIWADVLGLPAVGIRDSFFALGGHSLLVVRLMSQVQQHLGQKVPLATLFQEPTIEHLARVLRSSTPTSATPLVALQPAGLRPPFFAVHPGAGSVLSYMELARLLGPDQPFYGFQSAGLDGAQEPAESVDAMADAYVAALLAEQPTGPYMLGGWSFGGLVAYEMARRLTAQGHEIALLALIDSWAPQAEPATPPDDAAMIAWFASDLSRTFGAPIPIDADTFSALPQEAQLGYVLEQARAAGVLPPDISEADIARYLAVFRANLHAMYTHPRRPYTGRITLFRAGDRPLNEAGPTLGWEGLAEGGVDVQVIPGDHYGIVRQPHVATLATQLHNALTSADAHQSQPAD